MKNKVKTNEFEYEEEVREFTGLIFHCPKCHDVANALNLINKTPIEILKKLEELKNEAYRFRRTEEVDLSKESR